MLDTAGDHEQLARIQLHVPVAQMDRQWPLNTRKKSSVSSCVCQTNGPFNFTTWSLYSFRRPTMPGS